MVAIIGELQRPPSKEFLEGEKRAYDRLEALRIEHPAEWLRQVTPKVTELGLAQGMLPGEIDAKLQRYMREGPR